MLPRITHVHVVDAFRVSMKFSDGTSGEIDLAPWILDRDGVFLALQDQGYFARVRVHPESGTLVWPNGVDIDPDVLSAASHAAVVK